MTKKIYTFILTIIVLLSFSTTFATAQTTENAKNTTPLPELKAQHVVMLNMNTNAPVYSKAPTDKAYPASLTKIVTLLVAADLITDYNQVVTANKQQCWQDLVVGSSNIDIKDGEQLKIDDLMYAVAISSANEASNALAFHLCGSIEAFVEKMNQKAKELGAYNTNFVNTHGLHDENHYTTAYDMSLIAKAAFQNEITLKYLSTGIHTIPVTNKTMTERTLITTNKLMRSNESVYYQFCKAGKTGTTTAAGYNLITIAEKGDISFLVVTMNAPKESGNVNPIFTDTKNLYLWGFDNFSNKKILDNTEMIAEVKVELSAKSDHLVLVPEKNLFSVIPVDWDATILEREITTKKNIKAPIKQGEILGTITLKKDGVLYGQSNLIAANDVERSTVLHYLDVTENFFSEPWVIGIGILLLAFIIIYIIIMISQNKQKRKKKLKRRVRF